jgi:hypothetical protein
MTYVTGAQILAHRQVTSPSGADTTWAGLCADAIEGAIADKLEGATPTATRIDQLEVAAIIDGAALYATRAAPHGVLTIGQDGEAVRLGADSLREVIPVIRRIHATAGIGIG